MKRDMHLHSLLVITLVMIGADAIFNPFKRIFRSSQVSCAAHREPQVSFPNGLAHLTNRTKSTRSNISLQYTTDSNYLDFAVDGTKIPSVNFDAGESYAGTLSVDEVFSNPNKLFFWFWPSNNPRAKEEIVIWLNGGPGCSSLDGLLYEHGAFVWQPGTYEPQRNPFSWHRLSNIVYVDQPIGNLKYHPSLNAPVLISIRDRIQHCCPKGTRSNRQRRGCHSRLHGVLEELRADV
jgi:hypothetical protein